MREKDLISEGVHHVHNVGATGESTDGETSTDGFAQRSQVGLTVIPCLRTRKLRAERYHFIEHQQCTVVVCPLSQCPKKLRLSLH